MIRDTYDYPLQDTDMESVLMRLEDFIEEKLPKEYQEEAMNFYEEIWNIATQWAEWMDEDSNPQSSANTTQVNLERFEKLLIGLKVNL